MRVLQVFVDDVGMPFLSVLLVICCAGSSREQRLSIDMNVVIDVFSIRFFTFYEIRLFLWRLVRSLHPPISPQGSRLRVTVCGQTPSVILDTVALPYPTVESTKTAIDNIQFEELDVNASMVEGNISAALEMSLDDSMNSSLMSDQDYTSSIIVLLGENSTVDSDTVQIAKELQSNGTSIFAVNIGETVTKAMLENSRLIVSGPVESHVFVTKTTTELQSVAVVMETQLHQGKVIKVYSKVICGSALCRGTPAWNFNGK